MKKRYSLAICVLSVMMVFAFSGCAGKKSAKADYLDLINKIELGDSLEDVNKVVGSDGVLSSDGITYTWEVGGGGLSVHFQGEETDEAIAIALDYENKDVENKKVKIKDLEGLKKKVNEGITYDDFKELMGGVDGVLTRKGTGTNSYVWRNPDGSNVSASFQLETDLCNSFVGAAKE